MKKYIVFRLAGVNEPIDGCELPVVFPDCVPHVKVSVGQSTPVSAGFCLMTAQGWQAQGHSEGLNLTSRPDRDSALLNTFCK